MRVSQFNWMSRLTIGTSAVALAAGVVSCQDATLEKEPKAATLVPAEAAPSPPLGAVSPDKLPQVPTEAMPVATAPQKPGPPAAKAPPPPEPAATEELLVKRLVVTHAVENREPVPSSELVAAAQPVYAFLELANPADSARAVVVTFEHESGRRVGFVSLEVPPHKKRWRTWGRTAQITAPGDWSVVVSAEGGGELRRLAFEVKPQAAKPPAVASTDS